MAEKRALNPSGASSARSTDTSGGSAVLRASAAFAAGAPPVTSTLATCPGRVHAGVGPPCDGEPVPAARIDRVERLAERALDRPLAGLPRPAAERATVVLERQLQESHGRGFYHALTVAGPAPRRARDRAPR